MIKELLSYWRWFVILGFIIFIMLSAVAIYSYHLGVLSK
jgi:hypothetical protein